MVADVGVAADVEVTAEGVAAKDRGVAENNGMAPVSPDVRGATPDEALIETFKLYDNNLLPFKPRKKPLI